MEGSCAHKGAVSNRAGEVWGPQSPALTVLSGFWKPPSCLFGVPAGGAFPHVSSSGIWHGFICGLESDPKQTAFLGETNTPEPTNLLL